MNRLWRDIIKPIIEGIDAKYIVEIGSDEGLNTKNILEYCVEHDAFITSIDPSPKFKVHEFKSIYGDRFEIYQELSRDRLPLLADYDVVLMDGDHNWYTVYHELKIIEENSKNKKFPLVFLHDVGWPYARRDFYYNPKNIPEKYRQPYNRLGLFPGQPNLIENGGLNEHLYNAVYENNPKNGVLTAVEDFMEESDLKFSFEIINIFFGLGILFTENDDLESNVKEVIKSHDLLGELEELRIKDAITYRDLSKKANLLEKKLAEARKSQAQTEQEMQKTEKRLNNKLKKSNKSIKEKDQKIRAHYFEMEYMRGKNRSFMDKLISRFPNLFILFNLHKTGAKNALINIKGYNAVKRNQLFDVGFYLRNYKNVTLSGTDPLLHYLYHGFKEGKNPNPTFNGDYYLKKYQDVRKSNLNPLIHYSLYGLKEGRKSHPSKRDKFKLTSSQVKTKYEEILDKNRSTLNLYHFKDNAPLVSIIILTNNGIDNLKRLFKNFKKNIQYPIYEVIVVDNASTDDTISLLKNLSDSLPVKIIKNQVNKSFSKANNEAVDAARGEYVLLLNNDVEPTYGWLNQMMQTALKTENLGSVGAKLIYPDCSNSIRNKKNSFKIQHMGIAFHNSNMFYKPYNMGRGLEPFDPDGNLERVRAGNTAAVLLVKKDTYLEVGGLDERYDYGYEDVDFCLKLLKKGYLNVYCPKALLFHYEFGSQEKMKDHKYMRNKSETNQNLLISKWNSWISLEFFIDKLDDKGILSENPLEVTLL